MIEVDHCKDREKNNNKIVNYEMICWLNFTIQNVNEGKS